MKKMINYDENRGVFSLNTKETEYVMQVKYNKYLLHLHYGAKLNGLDIELYDKCKGFSSYDGEVGNSFSLNDMPTELSFFDSGDYKDTAIKIKNINGDSVTKFVYKGYKILDKRIEFDDMPYSRNGDETLQIEYFDEVSNCTLFSYYTVYFEEDVITRYIKIVNNGDAPVELQTCYPMQLDMVVKDYMITNLTGDYWHERNIIEFPVHFGKQGFGSKKGISSHDYNPYLAIKEEGATFDSGEAFAFEFVWSGDFDIQVEKVYGNGIRLLVGLNKDTFSYQIEPKASFQSPEVIMTFSSHGTNKLSQNLHNHIRNNIINNKYVTAKRPIVINTWEALHFNINEDVLFEYAVKAKQLGIDTIVIDDGWFGDRDDDTKSLGDWYVNPKKFINGIVDFSKKIHNLGLKLGIWVEPEMVSPNSDLFREHPDWIIKCKDRECSLGRNQYVLDLLNDEAIDYVVNSIAISLKDANIDYIKWDFNRSLSEVGSFTLSQCCQCEAKFRFVLGTYKILNKLIKKFPNTFFEGCAGGGGRFDAGMLYYFPQIWTSDNTDPFGRIKIQKGTSMAYPLSTISNHITNFVENKIEKKRDYDLRFNVAMGGVLGYEMDLLNLSEDDCLLIKEQINEHTKIWELISKGDLYYILDGENIMAYNIVSKDKKKCLLVYIDYGKNNKRIQLKGLDEKKIYFNKRYKISKSGAYLINKGLISSKLPKNYFHLLLESNGDAL